jgi:Ca2+-binding RTX toxin-like protein
MVGVVTVKGGLVPMNFSGFNATTAAAGLQNYTGTFGIGDTLGVGSVIYAGSGAVPDASESPNTSLFITSNTNVSVPGSYSAVYDSAYADTVTTGSSSLTTFLQDNGAGKGTLLNVVNGQTTVMAGGADTIAAGDASVVVFANHNGATVQGGTGSTYFIGGSGAVSVSGGAGNTTMFGSTGTADTILRGGSGQNYLVGGSGVGNTTLVGGAGPTWEFAAGTGPITMYAGSDTTIMVGVTGTGSELMKTGSGNALIGLNANSDTVIGGSGASTIMGGAGKDVYSFVKGQAGGTEIIGNFKVGKDSLIFSPEYGTHAVASEAVETVAGWGRSDVIQLTDGTTITLVGVTHKIES